MYKRQSDKQLQSGEIITKTIDQLGTGDTSIATALAIIAKEGTLDTADTIQFGNTVFLANRGVGANKNKMVGRAFNVDTGKNYLNNCLEYMEYLRKKGITHYSTSFTGSEVLKLMQLLQRVVKNNTDSRIYIAMDDTDPYAESNYITYFKVGKNPIPRVS